MGGRWVLGLGLVGCSGPDEPHDCDAGTPTCESSLLVLLPDPRVDFRLHVADELGMDLVVDCPIPAGGSEDFEDYSVICGSGRLTISTFLYFADEVDVELEEGGSATYTVDHQKGSDYCANPCTSGTIQL